MTWTLSPSYGTRREEFERSLSLAVLSTFYMFSQPFNKKVFLLKAISLEMNWTLTHSYGTRREEIERTLSLGVVDTSFHVFSVRALVWAVCAVIWSGFGASQD